MFEGRELLIATKHRKELVIAPILEKELGVKCVVTTSFDTDELGTFTGEIDRKDDPITTAKMKCYQAMELMGYDLAIASEGSFGRHPSIFIAPADDEFLVFIDKKNNLEIVARELSIETNFNGQEVKTTDDLIEFANQCKFPTHALIVRKSQTDFTDIKKGITDWKSLHKASNDLFDLQGSAYIETDMRAMYNPTRMKIIAQATQKLAKKINSCCPQCNTPGFGITDARKGLRCEQCNFPTRSISSYIYQCQKCDYVEEEKYPSGKQTEDPMYCDNCNP